MSKIAARRKGEAVKRAKPLLTTSNHAQKQVTKLSILVSVDYCYAHFPVTIKFSFTKVVVVGMAPTLLTAAKAVQPCRYAGVSLSPMQ